MNYEVVVVGGGIGGLTVAALLAARGVSVCLFERQDTTGGCAANVDARGYSFEGGAGLYSSWGPGELHERVFAELGVLPPEVRICEPSYVVRLQDRTDVPISANDEEFEEMLAATFPECALQAAAFYLRLSAADAAVRSAADRWPDLSKISSFGRLRVLGDARLRNLFSFKSDLLATHLQETSSRFRQFVDAQLQMLGQCSSSDCPFLYGAVGLMLPRRGMYSIRGGGSALAQSLTDSIKRSGGTVRINSPVLRLAYGTDGRPAGVDLLSGETVEAGRAIVSDLTIWDTYGKLLGRDRTPSHLSEQLKSTQSLGAYLLYLGMDQAAADRLPANHVLAVPDAAKGNADEISSSPFMFAATPSWDPRGPAGQRAVTVWTQTDTEQWFTFHRDATEIEAQDQRTLEAWWQRIHAALPELGSDVEVIETETPQTFYERTRRRLGMVGGVAQLMSSFGPKPFNPFAHRTPIPRLFMVGDTSFPGQGVAAVTHSALTLADELTK
ncbi:MAG: NAD(P)/FAD-dependent oxidoreductase [Pyrinomonadaceae bacterium]